MADQEPFLKGADVAQSSGVDELVNRESPTSLEPKSTSPKSRGR